MHSLNWQRTPACPEMMIGVGGVGSGMFFLLNGDQTLGREESRSGHFLKKDDYCKLHIIAHYVKVLLGDGFSVLPVARVGNDDVGRRLTGEMKDAGMDTTYIQVDPERHTLFSFCFLYPDRSGGNMTTDDSACSALTGEAVKSLCPILQQHPGKGLVLAAPEVPLEARAALLELASTLSWYRVASFTSEELAWKETHTLLRMVDLLCINLDEAASAIGIREEGRSAESIVEVAVRMMLRWNPHMQVSVTAGKDGSYLWDGARLQFAPALPVESVSTAGAGDAFTAGMIAGRVIGLSPAESRELATLVGACSVTSPHTIHKTLDRVALAALVRQYHVALSPHVLALLSEPQ